jgi:hypothetical protein
MVGFEVRGFLGLHIQSKKILVWGPQGPLMDLQKAKKPPELAKVPHYGQQQAISWYNH